MNVNQVVLSFQKYVVACWSQISLILENLDWDSDPYFIDHWLQSNWELLVERQLLKGNGFLHPYGFDANPECRQTAVGEAATHRLMVVLKSEKISYEFVSFVASTTKGNSLEPPFDKVGARDLSSRDISYFSLELVEFEVEVI